MQGIHHNLQERVTVDVTIMMLNVVHSIRYFFNKIRDFSEDKSQRQTVKHCTKNAQNCVDHHEITLINLHSITVLSHL